MSSKPLLEKIDNWSIGCSEENICKKHIKKDVVEALKKFKNKYYNYGRIYQLRDSELDIFDKLFNECFGKLPEERQ